MHTMICIHMCMMYGVTVHYNHRYVNKLNMKYLYSIVVYIMANRT